MKLKLFSIFLGHFALLDPDLDPDTGTPLKPDQIRMRIHNTVNKAYAPSLPLPFSAPLK
jgi:hypothetical protein